MSVFHLFVVRKGLKKKDAEEKIKSSTGKKKSTTNRKGKKQ